jgi:hypothetical protein
LLRGAPSRRRNAVSPTREPPFPERPHRKPSARRNALRPLGRLTGANETRFAPTAVHPGKRGWHA